MIVSITGPSGVGKTTLLHNLLRALPEAKPLTSVTTRAPRPTDEPGEYIYVSDTEFDAMSARGEFLWEVHPHGKKYATTKVAVDSALQSGLYIPILVIEAVQKLHQYVQSTGKKDSTLSFYLSIDDEGELRKRFAARADMTHKDAEARIAECRSWNEDARHSGVPFMYLDATKTRQEMLHSALAHMNTSGLVS